MPSLNFDALDGQIQRVSNVTCLDGFSSPVLITDVMKDWKGFGKWTLNYLEKAYGHLPICADKKILGEKRYFLFNFSSYIKYIRESTDTNPAYAKSTIHLLTEMKNEYAVPHYFDCWYRNYYEYIGEERRVSLSNLYIGPRFARSSLHIDIWGTSFWNALFCGKKLWVFIPKEHEGFIYDGEVDPFFPDLRKFPKYRNVTPQFCVQHPGELLYCPGNIWHNAMALAPSIALSENIINKANFEIVINTLKKLGYNNALRKMNDIIAYNLQKEAKEKSLAGTRSLH